MVKYGDSLVNGCGKPRRASFSSAFRRSPASEARSSLHEALPRLALLGVRDAGSSGRLGQVCQGIAGNIPVPHLEMQVCAGSPSAGADSRDGLYAYDAGAFSHQCHLVVAIDRRRVVVVADDENVAVAVEDAGTNYRPAICRTYGCPLRRRDIDSFVHRAIAKSEP